MAEVNIEQALAALPLGLAPVDLIEMRDGDDLDPPGTQFDTEGNPVAYVVPELTVEEWIERFVAIPTLTITQAIMSREIAAHAETFREPLGKRLSIRARRRWRGRARAWLRRTA